MSTEEVAREAGVGIATVFRHFPTKQDLLAAVLSARLDALRREAERLAEQADASEALKALFRSVVRSAPAKISIAEALEGGTVGATLPQGPAEAARLFFEATSRLVERAKATGQLRRDVQPADVFGLLIGVSRGAAYLGTPPAAADRMIDIVLAGLTRVQEQDVEVIRA